MTWQWLKDVFFSSASSSIDTSDVAAENQLFSYLIRLVNREDLIQKILDTYYSALTKNSVERSSIALDTYFALEKFLTTNHPIVVKKEYTREDLRKEIAHQSFTHTLPLRLKLIFLPSKEQTLAIAEVALSDIAATIVDSIGITRLITIVNHIKHANRFEELEVDRQSIQFQFTPSEKAFIQAHSDFRNLARLLLVALVSEIEQSLGSHYAQQTVARVFTFFQRHYIDYDIVSSLLGLMPPNWMEQERLALLTRDELAHLVQEKTSKLLHAEAEKRILIEQYNKKLEKEVRERTQELKKAIERLQELDKLKTEFLNLAAHELRTPLTVISWIYHEMLSGDLGAITPKQKSVLEGGMERARYMINLVGDLLNVSRIEDKKTPDLEREKISIASFMTDLIKDFQEQAQAKHIALIGTIEDKLPSGFFDTRQLKIALGNLLNNALKYTSNDGTITIEVHHKNNAIVITVHDTGIGIPANQLPYMFTKFFRAKNAIAANTTGSGLGLYITKSIIERHNGTISVQSTEHKGTTFTVTLPLQDTPQKAPNDRG